MSNKHIGYTAAVIALFGMLATNPNVVNKGTTILREAYSNIGSIYDNVTNGPNRRLSEQDELLRANGAIDSKTHRLSQQLMQEVIESGNIAVSTAGSCIVYKNQSPLRISEYDVLYKGRESFKVFKRTYFKGVKKIYDLFGQQTEGLCGLFFIRSVDGEVEKGYVSSMIGTNDNRYGRKSIQECEAASVENFVNMFKESDKKTSISGTEEDLYQTLKL